MHITRYSAAYVKFERRTKLVSSKLQCNAVLIECGWGVSAGCVKQKHSCPARAKRTLFLAKRVRNLTHLIMWTHFTFFQVLIWALIANLMTKSCFLKNWILSKQTFGREIIFEEFQPMWSRYLIVTDGRTDDGWHAISQPRSALATVMKWKTLHSTVHLPILVDPQYETFTFSNILLYFITLLYNYSLFHELVSPTSNNSVWRTLSLLFIED